MIKVNLAEKIPIIKANPGEINQVLLNLIINSSHAIKEKIESNPCTNGELHIKTWNDLDFVYCLIKDNGNGISKDNISKNKNKIPDTYSTSGLLHDLGRVVFFKLFKEDYEKVLKIKEEKSELLLAVYEKNIFNITHEELGAGILDYWELPSPIIEVALNHHDPQKSSNQFKDIVYVVHLADYFSWLKLNPKFLPEIKEEVFDYLGVNKLEIEELIKNIT